MQSFTPDDAPHETAYDLLQRGQTLLKRLGRRQEAGTHLRLAVAMSPQSELYRTALTRLGPPPRPSPRPPRPGIEP